MKIIHLFMHYINIMLPSENVKERLNNDHIEDLLVSIILSESTTTCLGLNVAHIEESHDCDGTTCTIHPLNKVDIINKQKKPRFFKYFYGDAPTDTGVDSDDISYEVGYFSQSYRSDSEESIHSFDENLEDFLDDDDTNISAVSPVILEPANVYTRPLLVAKSLAHQDKILMNNNNIYVSILDDELYLSPESEWMCRICHGGDSTGDLISPCRCRGSIALAHMACLERWLQESTNSNCELCKHHYNIIREPKYSVPHSILVFLRNPGEDLKELILDIIAFIIYTPSAVASTYMLMIMCENIAKSHLPRTRSVSAHLLAFLAVFGMAAIDFTYSSWLIVAIQKHTDAWRLWYKNNSSLKLILPLWKQKPLKKTLHVDEVVEEIDKIQTLGKIEIK